MLDKYTVIAILGIAAFMLMAVGIYYAFVSFCGPDPVVGSWTFSTSALTFYSNHTVATNWANESWGTWNKTGNSYQLDFNKSSSTMTYNKATDKINNAFTRVV